MGAAHARDGPGEDGGSSGALPPLGALLSRLDAGAYDEAIRAIDHRQQVLRWEKLPERIVLLRHGESEGNCDREIYCTKGDALIELTPKGLQQSREAGENLAPLVGDGNVFVVVSPFERTQQTLLALYQGGFPEENVKVVQVSPQIREKEFGNFQNIGLHEAARVEQSIVGRFYYRRPNAESSADVYDRVSAFWDDLVNDVLPRQPDVFETCVVVTHGLTLRLLLMKIFQWSVETFETVWNVENCEHVTLVKNIHKMNYALDPRSCSSLGGLWATRCIWIVFKSKSADPATEDKLRLLLEFKQKWRQGGGNTAWPRPLVLPQVVQSVVEAGGSPVPAALDAEFEDDSLGRWLEVDRVIDQTENARMRERSVPYTVLDYLSLNQPRTMQRETLDGRLVRGHAGVCREEALRKAEELHEKDPIDWSDVEFIDWWGSRLSYQGKTLRMREQLDGLSRKTVTRHLSSGFPTPHAEDTHVRTQFSLG